MAKTKKTPQESKSLSVLLELESSVISGVTSPNDICAEEMRMKIWYPTWRGRGAVLELSRMDAIGHSASPGNFAINSVTTSLSY